MLDISNIQESIPKEAYTLEDCWISAMTVLVSLFKKDTRLLTLNTYFYYKSMVNEEGLDIFQKMVLRNVAFTNEAQEDFEENIQIQNAFLEKMLGISCIGQFYEKINNLNEMIDSNLEIGNLMILWIDTYECVWNQMYNEVHFPHCILLLQCSLDKCFVFDSLHKESPFFWTSRSELFKMTYYINTFANNEDFICFKIDKELLQYYFCEFIVKYDGFNKYSSSLFNFSNDLIAAREQICDDLECVNENVIKLIMRIFVNEYQRCMYRNQLLRQIFSESNILCYFEEIESLWQKSASIFAKMYYLSREKRVKKYDMLLENCVKMKGIIDELSQMITIK